MNKIKLNNGIEIPCVGIGTFTMSPVDAESAVERALKNGYRMIDTANAYVNERAVGRGIKKSGINRKEIFVSTKLWPTEYNNPRAVDETLERLGLDYIDLLFLHQPAGDWQTGYRNLEKAYQEGKIKSIGISNFESEIDDLLNYCKIIPQVIQVECHPYFQQTELRKNIIDKDIKLMSWYPLGHGDKTLMEQPIFQMLAKKYDKSPAQVILKWHTQMGFVVIPGAKSDEHIKQNIDLFDFNLTQNEMQEIIKLDINKRYYYPTKKQLTMFENFKPEYEVK